MSAGKPIYAALQAVQRELKAPKGQKNTFGNYKYRSCEDIVEAVKPLLNENGLILIMGDEVINVENRFYVKATVKVIDVASGDEISTSAMARESETKRGMDDSQITGTASSYARKYALNGLFAIDDTKDADTDQYRKQTSGAQTSQNRPQGAANIDKGSNNTDMRSKAMKSLNEAMKQCGVTGAEVSAIAGVKYGKVSTKEMTIGEIADLANNLQMYIIETTGASA